MKQYCLFASFLLSLPLHAYVPFNPIIDPNDYTPYMLNNEIVGWLDVPDLHDRVLVRKKMNQDGSAIYTYIDPTRPDQALPKGLFCWLSTAQSEQPNFKDLQKHAALINSKTPISPKVEPQAGKKFPWTGKGYSNYDATRAQYTHPSKAVSFIFKNDSEDRQHKRLDRFYFFYDVVGVTEPYFREYFGNPTQLPSMQAVKKFISAQGFPYAHRNTIVGGCVVESVGTIHQKLTQKNPDPQRTGKGSITLVDGYQIYANAGGKFSGEPGLDPQNSIDLIPGAYNAREAADVRRLLADPQYKDAVFQVASTHAILEGAAYKPESKLMSMLKAPVQGEEIAAATAGASIYRKYLMNNVDLFSAVGGHGILGKGTLQNAAIDKIQIGWHPDVPVNSGFWPSYVYYDTKSKTNYISQKTPVDIRKRIDAYIQEKTLGEGRNIYNLFNSVVKDPMNQKINLALCAAHNMGSLKAKNTNDGNDARIVLRAMYKGTLESAALHGKKQVVLTLLGAGAFAGPYGSDILSWIVDALKENIDTIARYGLEITIVNYPDLRPHRIKTRHDALQLSKDMSALQNLLAQTNQKYTGQKGPQPTQPSALADKLKDLATALTNLANKLR